MDAYYKFNCTYQKGGGIIIKFKSATDKTELVGWDSVVGIATNYGLGRLGDRVPVGERFSAPVQIGPGAHRASYVISTESFS